MAARNPAADIEAQLASEGLAPLVEAHQVFGSEAAPSAVDVWQAWAREVLAGHHFSTPRQLRIWQLYAQGMPLTQVVAKVGGSRRSITLALERVEARSPRCPVENPWRKSGRTTPKPEHRVAHLARQANRDAVARLCSLAVSLVDRGQLLDLVKDDPELERLLPRGDMMGNAAKAIDQIGQSAHFPKADNGMRSYSRILLRQDVIVPTMRGALMSKDVLPNVEGRPHAGGIDVSIEAVKDNMPIHMVITIPWHAVKQADRIIGDS